MPPSELCAALPWAVPTGPFSAATAAAKAAAVLRSFVASCQPVGVDPFVWLKDILSRIADHPITRLAELLPHNWAPVQG
jgi:transposase